MIVIFFVLFFYVLLLPYCPEQAPMGARSSSAKIWGWAVTRRKCLNGSTIPEQGPTPDAKLAVMGPNRLASSVHPCFIEDSLTVEKTVSCYKADRLVASMLSFCSVQSLPAVRKFVLQGRNAANQATDRCVRTWCHGTQSASELCELSRPTFGFTTQKLAWWAVTRRTLKNHKTVKSGGWVLAREWALARVWRLLGTIWYLIYTNHGTFYNAIPDLQ